MFVRPRGWQQACNVQAVTMLGLSQLDTWWLAEGSHGLAFPDGSTAQAQRCWSTLLGHHHPKSQVLSVAAPVLYAPTSLSISCCCGHTVQPPRHVLCRGGLCLVMDKVKGA